MSANKKSSDAARRKLAALQRVLLLLGVAYIGLHLWVAYSAFVTAGAFAGLATLVTLGFGDLYWSIYGWDNGLAQVAMIAAIMAFASWLSRPFTKPYFLRLGLESIDWPQCGANDDVDAADAQDASGEGEGGAGTFGRPGGAA